MTNYKITTITPESKEQELKEIIQKIKEKVENTGGKIIEDKLVGHLKLAYPIKKETFATFLVFLIQVEGEKIKKIRKFLAEYESISRFLIAKAELIKKPIPKVSYKPKEPKIAEIRKQKPEFAKSKPRKIEEKKITKLKKPKKTPRLVEELESEKERLKTLDKKLDEILKE